MNSLNRILAHAMCEKMEYDLFDNETALAIDMISGQPTDDEEDESVEALHGSDTNNVNEGFATDIKVVLSVAAIFAIVGAGAELYERLKKRSKKKKEEKELNDPNNQLSKEEQTKLANIMIKELNPYIKAVNDRKSDIKEAINKEIEDFKSEGSDVDDLEYDLKHNNIQLKISEWEYNRNSFIFVLSEASQYTRCVLSGFIDMIGKEFCKNTKLAFITGHSYGDGDEGILVIHINPKYAKEYLNGGK